MKPFAPALIAAALCALAAPLPISANAPPAQPARKPDLADMLAGTWQGNVISDSRGSSRSNVTLTLTRVGVNQVRITSDYPRLPVVTVPVERVMQSVMAASGTTVFLYDMTRQPPKLDVSFNSEVSWAGSKAAVNPAQ